MNTVISLLGVPLGHVMRFCYGLLGSYGPAILKPASSATATPSPRSRADFTNGRATVPWQA